MHQEHMIAIAAIGLLGTLAQWFSWWVKLPAILFLLLIGLIIGPAADLLHPDVIFGDMLFPIISLSVAVILFEGSLTLKFNEIKGLEKVVRNLVSGGVIVSWVIIAIATRILLNFDWPLAFLFGALVVVTGPTVIVPMLRTVRPNARISNILRWEGIVIDPIGALLAVLVFEFIISSKSGHGSVGHVLLAFGKVIVVGFVAGAIGGQLMGVILRRYWAPEYLHNVITLTFLFVVFVVSNLLMEESGLLAVTVMGMWLANMKNVPIEDILNFKESLSVLLISGLFIILAARIEWTDVTGLGAAGLGVFLVIQFIARPAKVILSTMNSSLTWREKALLSWIAPRGIVAAAISALFALRLGSLEGAGFEEQAPLLVSLTFLVIIATVVFQSATSRTIANWLGVSEPEPKGLLIVGANPVARKIAKSLNEKGFNTLLTDSHWQSIRAARMDGLSTFYGNPTSEHADHRLDLVGIGKLIGLSPNNNLNTLAALRYQSEFGKNAVFSLTQGDDKTNNKHGISSEHRGRMLFGEEITYSKLASAISNGADIKATQLSEEFTFAKYTEQYGDKLICPLFFISPKGILTPSSNTEAFPKLVAGTIVLSLISPEPEKGTA